MNTSSVHGLVIVDKPQGITSHDVVGRCRRFFHTRKVGHAGTLDPLATGVLIIGINRATKILGLITASSKTYKATIRLGQTTTTEDIDGVIVNQTPAHHLDRHTIEQALGQFQGSIDQVPCTVSAIKVQGVRSYQLARQGKSVELSPRPIHISCCQLQDIRYIDQFVDLDVVIECSAGTYIRAIARDLGQALGVGGCLTQLRRTAVGNFTLKNAQTLEEIQKNPQLTYDLDQACLIKFPHRLITTDQAHDLSHGRTLEPAGITGPYAAVDQDGKVFAILCDTADRSQFVVVLRPATLPGLS